VYGQKTHYNHTAWCSLGLGTTPRLRDGLPAHGAKVIHRYFQNPSYARAAKCTIRDHGFYAGTSMSPPIPSPLQSTRLTDS
jgi:hypothetical protein